MPFHNFKALENLNVEELQKQRKNGDFRNCNVEILLNSGGSERIHCSVLRKYSVKYGKELQGQSVVSKRIDMTNFEADNVRKVINWMYASEIEVSESSFVGISRVCNYFQIEKLEKYLEHLLESNWKMAIHAMNVVAKMEIQENAQPCFRPYITLHTNMSPFLRKISKIIFKNSSNLLAEHIESMNIQSILGLMGILEILEKKVEIIFLAIDWILIKRASIPTINAIIQSLTIRDFDFYVLYGIRYRMKQYFVNTELRADSRLFIFPNGNFDIRTDKKSREMPHRPFYLYKQGIRSEIGGVVKLSITIGESSKEEPPKRPRSMIYHKFHLKTDSSENQNVSQGSIKTDEIESSYSSQENEHSHHMYPK